MIWNDTVKSIYDAINAQSIYNTSRSTTPSDLGLLVYNQTQDWLCMYKPWRDLITDITLVLDVNRKITMPSDFGCALYCYTDPSSFGKPMYYYYRNNNDIATRYTEEVAIDGTTGVRTVKFAFPPNVYIPSNPHVVYSKAIASVTAADVSGGTKLSFFPINLMLVVAKKILQDYYGVPANQDPNWITARVQEELKMFEGYAYQNNMSLDLSIKDRFGNPVFIPGTSMDGSKPRINRPSPFLPSTLYSGGTM